MGAGVGTWVLVAVLVGAGVGMWVLVAVLVGAGWLAPSVVARDGSVGVHWTAAELAAVLLGPAFG